MRPIHLARLDKTRPVLVLTRPIAVGRLRTVTVAAITSTIRGLATEVSLGPANGLAQECVVNLDTIVTLDHTQLGRVVGQLLDFQEDDLHAALVHTFDLNAPA